MESSNRAFMYGESVFTTMRLLGGKLQDLEAHFDRLKLGVEFLYGPFVDADDWAMLLRDRLDKKFQDLDGDKVIRCAIYIEHARGLFRKSLLSSSDLKINISLSPLTPLENKMIKLRTCPANQRPYWWPSYLKAGNYLETILAQKLFMKPQDDDVLFLSENDTVLESSVANIFVVRHDNLFTAPTGPNVLAGVMRKKVLDVADDFFQKVEETETTLEQLMRADAVFGSNSVRGLFLIDRIDDNEITYTQNFLDKFEKLRSRVCS